jgi:hypothetical protein
VTDGCSSGCLKVVGLKVTERGGGRKRSPVVGPDVPLVSTLDGQCSQFQKAKNRRGGAAVCGQSESNEQTGSDLKALGGSSLFLNESKGGVCK